MHWKLMAAGGALAIGCGIPLAIVDLATAQATAAASAAAGADQMRQARDAWLPKDQTDTAVTLVTLIGQASTPSTTDVSDFCDLLYSPDALRELETSLGVPNCPDALATLHREVTDPAAYIDNVFVPDDAYGTDSTGQTDWLNGCRIQWNSLFSNSSSGTPPPGPLLGHLTLTHRSSMYGGGGWQITDYRPC